MGMKATGRKSFSLWGVAFMGVTGINVEDFQARDVIKYASLTVIEK